MKKALIGSAAAFGLLVVGFCVYAGVRYQQRESIPFFYRKTTGAYWSAGTTVSATPLNLDVAGVSVLDRAQMGVGPKHLVADPFLARSGSEWFVFYEIMGATGADIGVSRVSLDGENEYLGIALDEPFHLSYPFVFESGGSHYLVPESKSSESIRLYRADEFPLRWSLEAEFLKGIALSDPTLIEIEDHWYLFAEAAGELHLFSAPELFGPWAPHPQNPIRVGNYSRPAGRVGFFDGRLLRFGQDQFGGYGRGVYGFEIEQITPTTYRESAIQGNPVLTATGNGFAKNGMHHIDAHRLEDGRYLVAVDGAGYGRERIGFSIWN